MLVNKERITKMRATLRSVGKRFIDPATKQKAFIVPPNFSFLTDKEKFKDKFSEVFGQPFEAMFKSNNSYNTKIADI